MDDMSIWEKYSPILNPWFSSELIYAGWGKASFENPIGTVEGKTKINVNDLGDLKIEMEYERLETKEPISSNSETFRILKFLHQYSGKNDRVVIGIGDGNKNPCSKLIVETGDGVFTSEENISWTALDFNDRIVFWITRGTFEVTEKIKPKYWVAPLINYISEFSRNQHPLLIQHPLRLYSTPTVLEIEDKDNKNNALLAANRKNFLIGFEFGEKIGFIERLPDYSEKEQRLKSEQVRQCVTALMIGEITGNLENTTWFPHEYTNLLSFTSGSEVGASWLEFRNEEGKLVSRKHFSSHKTCYEKGYAVINESLHGGTGHLISVASNSSEFQKSHIRVLINHLTQVSSYNRHLENRMTILIRAIEGISEKHGFGSQNLMDYLPVKYQQSVKEILTETKHKTEKLMRQAQKENLIEASIALRRIGNRVENANNKDGDFGLKVVDLLKFYKLPDSEIMEKHYSETNSESRSWASFLSQMRNDPIHTGYFEMEKGTYESDEIIKTQDHLHDILIRIVLKTLGYEGEYQPRVIDHLTDGKTVNWVTKESTLSDLGYKRNYS